jgi:hypothetical protein
MGYVSINRIMHEPDTGSIERKPRIGEKFKTTMRLLKDIIDTKEGLDVGAIYTLFHPKNEEWKKLFKKKLNIGAFLEKKMKMLFDMMVLTIEKCLYKIGKKIILHDLEIITDR